MGLAMTTAVRSADLPCDTVALFARLSAGVDDAVLLESLDGNGLNNRQSLLFVRSALRIEGRGRRVLITPLTAGGRRAIDPLLGELGRVAEVVRIDETLVASFPPPVRGGTDAERIAARTTADALRTVLECGREGAALLRLAGVFAYDFVEQLEDLPPAREDRHRFPDFVFWVPERLAVVDHTVDRVELIAHAFGDDVADAAQAEKQADEMLRSLGPRHSVRSCVPAAVAPDEQVAVDLDDRMFAELVEELRAHVVAGDVFQIVPSRTFSASCPDPAAAYAELRALNPSPYMFFVKWGELVLLGASPETCVRVSGEPRRVEVRPIAGTRPRGRGEDGELDEDADRRLEAELRLNEKEVAEHMMLVDLARNDVARISRAGTRRVARLLQVERYSHVMHLVSAVEGELREGLDALHAYLASANMGTLVGAPKIEAARLLRRYEADRRGPYGGAVGYLCSDGTMDTAIVIRSALVRDGRAHVRAGAGVVFDSDPEAEARETRAKAQAVLRAVQLAGQRGAR
ncbi:MAG: anthranilate synthase component 1 [Deltaproteobacteria bacterium]|nr:anthranilate synthase component 1 [Deltaproteobacteria bacterium]